MLDYIVWTADPTLFHLDWKFIDFAPRWYGLLFAAGFLISQQVLFYIFRSEGHKEEDVETLTVFMVLATIIGARLGHVLFYEPAKYLANPIDILKVWEGGLASHGAAIGILTALYLYSNYDIQLFQGKVKKRPRQGQSFLWVVDRIVIVVALTGGLIRFGNFMNSEIIGKPTGSDYGVVFARDLVDILENSPLVDEVEVRKGASSEASTEAAGENYRPVEVQITFNRGGYQEAEIRRFVDNDLKRIMTGYASVREHIYEPPETPVRAELTQRRGAYVATVSTYGIPRHPAQLYESITTFLASLLLFFLWTRLKRETPEGLFLGIFLIWVFGLRFVHEFFKEDQVAWEGDIPLNMGQWLSIPLVLIGVYLLLTLKQRKGKKRVM
ncbi:MAG: prolipoprotein diacylglyceryl transferase [Tunicatimonas sp.]